MTLTMKRPASGHSRAAGRGQPGVFNTPIVPQPKRPGNNCQAAFCQVCTKRQKQAAAVSLLDQLLEDQLLYYLVDHPEGFTLDRAGWRTITGAGWTREEVKGAVQRLFEEDMIYTTGGQGGFAQTLHIEKFALEEYREKGYWNR